MSYPTIETSRDSGMPVELYQISYTNNFFTYTSADTKITYLASDYMPVPITRSTIAPTTDVSKSNLTLTFPGDSPIGQVFRVSPPSEPVYLTVFSEHYLDGSFTTIWKGRIVGVEWVEGSALQLTSENVYTSLQRNSLRRRCQLTCPFALYGKDCGLLREDYVVDTTLTSLSGLSLTVSSEIGKIDAWYAGGYVTWANSVTLNTEKRFISESVSASGILTIASLPVGLANGQAIRLYPGCDHTLEGVNGCSVKFNNFARYGGAPYMPTKNPFNGTAIY